MPSSPKPAIGHAAMLDQLGGVTVSFACVRHRPASPVSKLDWKAYWRYCGAPVSVSVSFTPVCSGSRAAVGRASVLPGTLADDGGR
jgi:hypothetical protein